MIPLRRIRDENVIHRNFRGDRRVEVSLRLLEARREVLREIKAGNKKKGASQKWSSKIWRSASDQLIEESNKKCAYCETPHRITAYGDVEHFRPKSKYWWLAYCYENYLPSCIACNQEYKKNFFKRTGGVSQLKSPIVKSNSTDSYLEALAPKIPIDAITSTNDGSLNDFEQILAAEEALLINPYVDTPSDFIDYKPLINVREILVIPNESNGDKKTTAKAKAVIKACESLFGINRQELKDLRFQWFCFYMTFRNLESDDGLSQNKSL